MVGFYLGQLRFLAPMIPYTPYDYRCLNLINVPLIRLAFTSLLPPALLCSQSYVMVLLPPHLLC